MNFGHRIKTIRILRGLSQKKLGVRLGFNPDTAGIRIAQYESGKRTPKEDLFLEMAEVLNVQPEALNVPELDISSADSFIQLLFLLEDNVGLSPSIVGNRACLDLKGIENNFAQIFTEFFVLWREKYMALLEGKITQEEYDFWRYNYCYQ